MSVWWSQSWRGLLWDRLRMRIGGNEGRGGWGGGGEGREQACRSADRHGDSCVTCSDEKQSLDDEAIRGIWMIVSIESSMLASGET